MKSKILETQRKQLEMALQWLKIIDNPFTLAPDKKIAIEQYAITMASIVELASAITNHEFFN